MRALNDSTRRVLETIALHPHATQVEVATIVDLTPQRVHQIEKALVQNGYLTRRRFDVTDKALDLIAEPEQEASE